jgi:hypothetical protein
MFPSPTPQITVDTQGFLCFSAEIEVVMVNLFLNVLLGSPLDFAKAAETLYGVLCVFPSLCVCLQLYASLLVYLRNKIIDLVCIKFPVEFFINFLCLTLASSALVEN